MPQGQLSFSTLTHAPNLHNSRGLLFAHIRHRLRAADPGQGGLVWAMPVLGVERENTCEAVRGQRAWVRGYGSVGESGWIRSQVTRVEVHLHG